MPFCVMSAAHEGLKTYICDSWDMEVGGGKVPLDCSDPTEERQA